ncbi:hypothetical protein DFJ73DRAFT_832846 [Zopfochytrium polystomum]|nr:hypothetical protein DFJ73DRAFT_832846 [Zopfochytrium polystomum]
MSPPAATAHEIPAQPVVHSSSRGATTVFDGDVWAGYRMRQLHAAAFLRSVAAGDSEIPDWAIAGRTTKSSTSNGAAATSHHQSAARFTSAGERQPAAQRKAFMASSVLRFSNRRSRPVGSPDGIELDTIVVDPQCAAEAGNLPPFSASKGKKPLRDLDYDASSNKSVPIPLEVEALISTPPRKPYPPSFDVQHQRRTSQHVVSAQSTPDGATGSVDALAVPSPVPSIRTLNGPREDDSDDEAEFRKAVQNVRSDSFRNARRHDRSTSTRFTSPSQSSTRIDVGKQAESSTPNGEAAIGLGFTFTASPRGTAPTTPTPPRRTHGPPNTTDVNRRKSAPSRPALLPSSNASNSSESNSSTGGSTALTVSRPARVPGFLQYGPAGLFSALWERAASVTAAAVGTAVAVIGDGSSGGWLTSVGERNGTGARSRSTGSGVAAFAKSSVDASSSGNSFEDSGGKRAGGFGSSGPSPRVSAIGMRRGSLGKLDPQEKEDTLVFALSEVSSSDDSDSAKHVVISGRMLQAGRRSSRQMSMYKEKLIEARVVFTAESGSPLSMFSMIPHIDPKVKQRRARPRSRFGSQALEKMGISLAIEAVRKKVKVESYAHLINLPQTLLIYPPEYPTYNPYYLDDPELKTGKHRTVINLPCYIGSIIQYSKPADIKKELNEHFRETHPTVDVHLTLSQIRNLKNLLVKVALARDLELSSVAMAFAYFEKLVIKGFATKVNRRLIAAVCLILAVKINDPKETDYGKLVETIEDEMEIPPKEIYSQEFSVYAALEFTLFLPQWEVLPHLERIIQVTKYKSAAEYCRGRTFYLG